MFRSSKRRDEIALLSEDERAATDREEVLARESDALAQNVHCNPQ